MKIWCKLFILRRYKVEKENCFLIQQEGLVIYNTFFSALPNILKSIQLSSYISENKRFSTFKESYAYNKIYFFYPQISETSLNNFYKGLINPYNTYGQKLSISISFECYKFLTKSFHVPKCQKSYVNRGKCGAFVL